MLAFNKNSNDIPHVVVQNQENLLLSRLLCYVYVTKLKEGVIVNQKRSIYNNNQAKFVKHIITLLKSMLLALKNKNKT